MTKAIDFRPVILAGGSGTRFWPRSRRARAKQVLALDGDRSMLQQTVERLRPIAEQEQVWVITNELLAAEIEAQLPGVPRGQIVEEPVARNTAPACGLAAFLVEKSNPDAVIGVFPSDHVIGLPKICRTSAYHCTISSSVTPSGCSSAERIGCRKRCTAKSRGR